jgi:hypothetical protein
MLPATITKIQQPFEEIKHMHCDTWEGDHLPTARDALKEILEFCMADAINAIWSKREPKAFPTAETAPTPVICLQRWGIWGSGPPHPNLQRPCPAQTLRLTGFLYMDTDTRSSFRDDAIEQKNLVGIREGSLVIGLDGFKLFGNLADGCVPDALTQDRQQGLAYKTIISSRASSRWRCALNFLPNVQTPSAPNKTQQTETQLGGLFRVAVWGTYCRCLNTRNCFLDNWEKIMYTDHNTKL